MRATPVARGLILLVLAAALAPSAAAQEAAESDVLWSIEDPTADTPILFGAVPATYPATPLNAHIDLTGVTVPYEDETGIQFDLNLVQLRTGQGNLCCLAFTSYQIQFGLQGTQLLYTVFVNVQGSDTNPDTSSTFLAQFADAYMCVRAAQSNCYYQPVQATLDDENDAIHVWIPKASLLAKLEPPGFFFNDQRPPGIPATIKPGQQLVDLVFQSFYSPLIFGFVVQQQDRAPNDGEAPPFAFRHGVANTIVSIEVGDELGQKAVQAGDNQSVEFTIHNEAAAKRLIRLEYEVFGPEEAVRKYAVWGPSTVTVPGGESRSFRVAVDVQADASPTDSVRFVIRGVSVGHEDEVGLGVAQLVPSAALGPGADKLYLQAQAFESFVEVAGAGVDPLCRPTAFITLSCTFPFLSPVEDHPYGAADAAIHPNNGAPLFSGGIQGGPGAIYSMNSDVATATPIMFSRDDPITISLDLRAPNAVANENVQIEAVITYNTEETSEVLFEETATASVGAAATTATITGPARFNPDVRPFLPAGTTFNLRLWIEYPAASTGWVPWTSGSIEILPRVSFAQLPLVELPDDLKQVLVDSPLQMSPVGGPEDFVNPGEARLYNVSVLNQAQEPVRFVLTAENTPGWLTDLLPGRRYEIEAGDTLTFGALVHAPENVGEGEIGIVRVNATTIGFGGPDANVSAVGVTLRTVVTNFDLPDDSGMFNASADDEAKLLEEDGGKSPGPGLAFFAVAVGALVALTRRRRRNA